jgi:GT2 family glycosyltransferase
MTGMSWSGWMPLIEAPTASAPTETRSVPSPSVSVVVCTYTDRRRPELLDALRSLRRQSRDPHEVIVVVDHNPALLGWLRAQAPDVLAIENRQGPGLSGARNSGVRTARGSVVAFLDDDAVADAGWVECLSAAYRDPAILGAGGSVLPDWERRPSWFPEEFEWVVGCTYRGLPLRRSAVRNLIGCNMSFRREVFEQLGGFTTRLGRVAGRPLGCEETELCIRIGEHSPSRTLLYDPAVKVHHRVPRERSTLRYFVSRCYSEGISKAELARLAGGDRGLASERSYALRTLPSGIWGDLKAACLHAEAAPLGRAAAIFVGFCFTLAGFAAASLFGSRRPSADDAVEVGAP